MSYEGLVSLSRSEAGIAPGPDPYDLVRSRPPKLASLALVLSVTGVHTVLYSLGTVVDHVSYALVKSDA